ncbi:MAG: hypothetical protein AAGC74_12085 [Verrucomicrobiota bacterium]
MTNLFFKRPWLLLTLCFLILIAAWSSLITIAVKFRPQSVPAQTTQTQHP